MEKFRLFLEKARIALQRADHMIYITYPIVKEQRLLLKVLEELHSSLADAIKAVLYHEYTYKRIKLYADAKLNFRTFGQRCAQKLDIQPEDINSIKEIFYMYERHQASPMEFVRQDKLVILGDDLRTEALTLEKLKAWLLLAKNILHKAGTLQKAI